MSFLTSVRRGDDPPPASVSARTPGLRRPCSSPMYVAGIVLIPKLLSRSVIPDSRDQVRAHGDPEVVDYCSSNPPFEAFSLNLGRRLCPPSSPGFRIWYPLCASGRTSTTKSTQRPPQESRLLGTFRE